MLKKYLAKIKETLQERKEFFLLTGIILIGLILRMINIGTEPYWGDEILSLEIARHYIGDAAGLWHYLQIAEIHPPLYYYLIQIWGGWFGFGEAAIRSLSLIFSLGLIILTYWAGIVFFKSKKIGLLSAFFTAILPIQIEFGQEARPYAIFCFFGILNIILLYKYFQERWTAKRVLLLASFVITSVIGLYLHYSYFLILLPLSLYWLGRLIITKNSKEFIWWLGTMGIIFLGFYIWLPIVLFKSFFIKDITTEINRMAMIMTRPFDFFESALNNLLWANKEATHIIEIIAAVIAKLMFGVLMVLIVKDNQSWLGKNKNSLIFLISLLLSSIMIFIWMPSSVIYTTFNFKHIISSSIILSLLIGAIFVLIDNTRWRVICIFMFMVSLLTFQIKIISDDSLNDFNYRYKIVVDYISDNYKDGDMLLTYIAQIRPQLNYYLKDGMPIFVSLFPSDMLIPDFLETRDTLGFMENESQFRFNLIERPSMHNKLNYLTKKERVKRVWVIGEGSTGQIRRWFVSNGWIIRQEPVNNLFPLALYEKRQE